MVQLPPTIKKFNRPPTMKPRGAHATPKVHIAINITPTLGLSGTTVQGSYVVSDSPIVQRLLASTPGPSVPAEVSNDAACTKPLSDLAPTPAPHGPCNHLKSPLFIMLDSLGYSVIPTIFELLSMMDHEDLTCDLKYVDMCSEFQDLDIYNAVDVYTLGVEHLAMFGFLGMDGACLLYKYMHDIILSPLGLMKTRLSEEPSVEEVAALTQVLSST